jgi:hypothetical protein
MSLHRPESFPVSVASTIRTPRGSGDPARASKRLTLPLLGLLVVCGSSSWASPLPLDPDRPRPGPETGSSPGGSWSVRTLADLAVPHRLDPRTEATPDSGPRTRAFSGLVLGHSFEDAARQRTFEVADLSRALLSRMETEARRLRGGQVYDPMMSRAPFDSVAEEARTEVAETILMRSFNRTLESQADALVRTSPGLGTALDWLDNFGSRRRSSPGNAGTEGPAAEGVRRAAGNDLEVAEPRSRASLGLRVGVHPRLVLKSDFAGFRARLEIPLPGEPVRLSVERPLGDRGRLVFSSGLQGGDQSWAALGWTLRF